MVELKGEVITSQNYKRNYLWQTEKRKVVKSGHFGQEA
jgi:hypothetical protein